MPCQQPGMLDLQPGQEGCTSPTIHYCRCTGRRHELYILYRRKFYEPPTAISRGGCDTQPSTIATRAISAFHDHPLSRALPERKNPLLVKRGFYCSDGRRQQLTRKPILDYFVRIPMKMLYLTFIEYRAIRSFKEPLKDTKAKKKCNEENGEMRNAKCCQEYVRWWVGDPFYLPQPEARGGKKIISISTLMTGDSGGVPPPRALGRRGGPPRASHSLFFERAIFRPPGRIRKRNSAGYGLIHEVKPLRSSMARRKERMATAPHSA